MEEEAASAQSTSVDTGCGITVRSLALETQAQTPMDLSRRGLVGGQSYSGGVHSVTNETPLAPRTSSATTYPVHSSSVQESTLERLSHSQYHSIPHTHRGASRHHSSASRDQPWSLSSRSTYLGGSRDDSRSSRGSFLQEVGDPPYSSSPRRLLDTLRDIPSLGSRPELSCDEILKEVLRAIQMPDLLV